MAMTLGAGVIEPYLLSAFPSERSMECHVTEDEQAIRDVIESWTRASQNGDVATVLSLMTEDAVFTVPGREPFGREVFEAAAGSNTGRIDGTNEIVELQVLGDWAFTRNRIDLTVTPPAGDPVRRSGYTLTLFRKGTDGRWRLARDANLLTVRSSV
jgi:uncharacterized protein (TIGR02246 family)